MKNLVKQKEYNMIKSASILKQHSTGRKQRCNLEKASNWGKQLSPEAVNKLENAENKETEEYQATMKMLNARISNLQSNLHIKLDIERYEDRFSIKLYRMKYQIKDNPMPADSELNKQKIVEKAKVEAP